MTTMEMGISIRFAVAVLELGFRTSNKNKFHYLDLFEWHFETERFIVVRIKGVLFDCRLLLLQPLAVLHQVNLDVGI